MSAMGFDSVEFTKKTTKPLEDQFWDQFDGLYELTEATLKEDMPVLITDPTNKAAIEAMMNEAQEQIAE
jgi:translation initiation factor 2 alpha subunit (eIF-2alpha)